MRYFRPEEFKCDGQVVYDRMQPELLTRLDAMRDFAGVPIRITSSWRDEKANRKAGGKKDSAHLHGWAVDVACGDSVTRMILLASAIRVGFPRIGIGGTFLHVDTDPSKPWGVIWLY